MWGTSQPRTAITTGSWSPWAPIGNVWFLLCGAGLLGARLCTPGCWTSLSPSLLSSSHRACVAGFTNITFSPDSGLIDGNGSYVSFSRYSEAVFLPQDPGRGRTSGRLALHGVSTEGWVSVALPGVPGGLQCLVSPLRSGDVPWPQGAPRPAHSPSASCTAVCRLLGPFSVQRWVCPRAGHTG